MEFYYDNDPDKNDYDDDNDEEVSSKSKGSSSIKTASAIYNTEYKFMYIRSYDNTTKTLILKILLTLSKYPIFLSVNYQKDPNSNEMRHVVELRDITTNSITISNPWGQIETYTNTGKNIENSKHPPGYNTEIQDYQDFIKRIAYIIFSKELLLLAIKSEPLLSKLLPNILSKENEITKV
jgi:hypothetical protein